MWLTRYTPARREWQPYNVQFTLSKFSGFFCDKIIEKWNQSDWSFRRPSACEWHARVSTRLKIDSRAVTYWRPENTKVCTLQDLHLKIPWIKGAWNCLPTIFLLFIRRAIRRHRNLSTKVPIQPMQSEGKNEQRYSAEHFVVLFFISIKQYKSFKGKFLSKNFKCTVPLWTQPQQAFVLLHNIAGSTPFLRLPKP